MFRNLLIMLSIIYIIYFNLFRCDTMMLLCVVDYSLYFFFIFRCHFVIIHSLFFFPSFCVLFFTHCTTIVILLPLFTIII